MSTETTSPETAQSATHFDAIDLSKPQLLGLFSGGDGPRALLRSPDGTITTASVADATPLGEVVAITDTYVLLRDADATIRRLMMPV
ncbi:hypothetical protein SAMN05444287_1687 [Octadecabacter temperatus]|uniref:Uncharacterized protein n=1 Tax=Octadecabacter temperatus TaxID=1458307 RepID=A0A0K0Y6M8_9RHOB|nr:hypothetical protein [Octadecabacter temperatus]AKS46570.1 hypothetical protein OSB_20310 [Octadecabacter temperatus]SIO16840.1 hypothetical protein SAMN05444287_1687 [Octadecabacter temperatus]